MILKFQCKSSIDAKDNEKTKPNTESIKIKVDKGDEIESTLSFCLINGLEFEDAFEKLMQKDLIALNENENEKEDKDKDKDKEHEK